MKVARRTLDDGWKVHSFQTFVQDLHTIVRNTCRTPTVTQDAPTFALKTTPTPQQTRALALIETITW